MAEMDLAWLRNECKNEIGRVLQEVTGETGRIQLVPDPDPETGAVLWWEQPLNLEADSHLWVGAGESTWAEIGRLALQAAAIESAEPSDWQRTYLEIIAQALSAVARTLGTKHGSSFTAVPGRLKPAAPSGPSTGLAVTIGGRGPFLLLFAASLDTTGLSGLAAEVQAGADGPPSHPIQAIGESKTLDLLMEVELPVAVSFGRARLPLRDALKLTSGSLIELNRAVSEPVEVIVNNCVIARGEVVVVEGNYGVQITQIMSRQQRLRTLS